MTDIVAGLRAEAAEWNPDSKIGARMRALLNGAADEIEFVRSAYLKAEARLDAVRALPDCRDVGHMDAVRAALDS